MRVLIDTNVLIDVFAEREPHHRYSASVLGLCGKRITGCITVSQTNDIYYILRRAGKSVVSAKNIIKTLTDNVKVVTSNSADVQNALASEMPDYEDALLACCAKRQKARYIVTRNEKDFNESPVPAIAPQAFLEQYY